MVGDDGQRGTAAAGMRPCRVGNRGRPSVCGVCGAPGPSLPSYISASPAVLHARPRSTLPLRLAGSGGNRSQQLPPGAGQHSQPMQERPWHGGQQAPGASPSSNLTPGRRPLQPGAVNGTGFACAVPGSVLVSAKKGKRPASEIEADDEQHDADPRSSLQQGMDGRATKRQATIGTTQPGPWWMKPAAAPVRPPLPPVPAPVPGSGRAPVGGSAYGSPTLVRQQQQPAASSSQQLAARATDPSTGAATAGEPATSADAARCQWQRAVRVSVSSIRPTAPLGGAGPGPAGTSLAR